MKRVELNLMVKQAIELYTQHEIAKGLSPQTIAINEMSINNFLKIVDLTQDDYVSVISERLMNKYLEEVSKSSWSLASKNINICHLRTFLHWCMEKNFIEQFDIKTIRGQEPKIKFFTDEEVEKLLIKPKKNCSFGEARSYALVCFLLSTGARASTIVNLTFDDIDFKARTITYRTLKNKSVAIIPMTDSLYKVLLEYVSEWVRNDKKWFFCSDKEQQLTVRNLTHSLYKYCRIRGVKPRGAHSFRHTYARLYIKNGGDAFTLQRILTHSSISTTQIYVKLFSDDLRESLKEYSPLDNLIKNGNKIRRN